MQAGLHKLWNVYRATKRGGQNQEASIFMIEKKAWDKKKSENTSEGYPSPNMREEAFTCLRRDALSIMKLRHPSILNLIEQPSEDEKYIVFITERVEYTLACLQEANTPGSNKDHLREKIMSRLEIKCLMLELMETLNFMHANAKVVHGGLSPENLFITASGKVKIGGLNFCSPLGTEEQVSIPTLPTVRFNEFTMYPNLKFASPEVSMQMPKISVYSDLYSAICILFYLLALEKGRDPYVLGQYDSTSSQ